MKKVKSQPERMSPEVQSEIIARLNTKAEVLRAEAHMLQRARTAVKSELVRAMRGEW